MLKLIKNPYKIILISLILIALWNATVLGIDSLIPVILATFTAILSDSIISYIKFRKIAVWEGPAISGLLLGLVLSGSAQFVVLAAIVAQLLKHIIQLDKRNIFNPAALSIFVFAAFFPQYGADGWNGNLIVWLAALLGIIVSWTVKRISASFSFLLLFAFATAIIRNNPEAVLSQLFLAFFMITEPKTSPVSMKNQIIYGSIAGVVAATGFALALPSPPLLGLLIANILNFIMRKLNA